jgi:hypothetical protein
MIDIEIDIDNNNQGKADKEVYQQSRILIDLYK